MQNTIMKIVSSQTEVLAEIRELSEEKALTIERPRTFSTSREYTILPHAALHYLQGDKAGLYGHAQRESKKEEEERNLFTSSTRASKCWKTYSRFKRLV